MEPYLPWDRDFIFYPIINLFPLPRPLLRTFIYLQDLSHEDLRETIDVPDVPALAYDREFGRD
jgi:hypothetical protein